MQGSIGGGTIIIVPETPHAADLGADFEQGHIRETGLDQVFGTADTGCAGTDNGDTLFRCCRLCAGDLFVFCDSH